MDISVLMPWLLAGNTIVSLGTAAYAVLTTGSKANTQKIEAVEIKLTDHDRRVQAIESELKHLPDKDTVIDLRLALADLGQKVAVMGESVQSTSRTVRRIDDYLHKREEVK